MKNPDHESAIQDSLRYLDSDKAMQSIEANVYWPKWNSPWWHMTLLNEMGMAKRIPSRAVRKMTAHLKASPLASHCHCGLGNIYQALAAAGLDVDQELPWIRPWFLRYQLPDGGLNCDEAAYLKDPPPSSIVGTITPLEAVLFHTPRPFTAEEERFLDRGAQCLLERKLMYATSNPQNAEEKEDEADWLKLCFPRFYLYDVLRGLNFVLHWANLRNQPISRTSIGTVVQHLKDCCQDSETRIERHSYEGISTKLQSESWDWKRRQPATHFSLLDQVSQIGSTSPYLTTRWNEAERLMSDLTQRGLMK